MVFPYSQACVKGADWAELGGELPRALFVLLDFDDVDRSLGR